LPSSKIGLLTIGQSPRVDIVQELREALPREIETIEVGALDGLEIADITSLSPRKGDDVLVTRLRDGSEVALAERRVIPLIQKRLIDLSRHVTAIGLLCTGEFTSLKSDVPLIEPWRLLDGVVRGIVRHGSIGVMIPSSSQTIETKSRWGRLGFRAHIEAASPYHDMMEIERAASRLAERDLQLVVMDCMGYSAEMKEIVKAKTKRPVILSRSVLAKVLSELV
jgi:protein AroM